MFRFDGVTERKGPNYTAARGAVAVSRGGTVIETLYPEKRAYNAGGMPMTNAAIDSGITGDLYVSMGEPVDGGAWIIRVYSKPFITWVWGGFVLMALGGFLALIGPPLPAAGSGPSPLPSAHPAAARRRLGMHTS